MAAVPCRHLGACRVPPHCWGDNHACTSTCIAVGRALVLRSRRTSWSGPPRRADDLELHASDAAVQKLVPLGELNPIRPICGAICALAAADHWPLHRLAPQAPVPTGVRPSRARRRAKRADDLCRPRPMRAARGAASRPATRSSVRHDGGATTVEESWDYADDVTRPRCAVGHTRRRCSQQGRVVGMPSLSLSSSASTA